MAESQANTVYTQIKKRILEEGYYRPSQRLIEAQLSEDLKVGRHIIRLALTRLDAEGLVRIEPNRGATVATVSLEEAKDILMAREVLEGAAARLAAERISDEQLHTLRAIRDEMAHRLDENQLDLYSQANVKFHGIIYEACGSTKIPEIIASLRARVVRIQFRTILLPGRGKRSLAEHTAILEALERRAGEEAETAMRAHINSLRQALSDPHFSYMM